MSQSNPPSRIQQVRIKYTNNCTKLGEMATRVAELTAQMALLTDENRSLNREHDALKIAAEEAVQEEKAKVADAKPAAKDESHAEAEGTV